MKLQKNNKYEKKVTAGLGALIVSLGILTGCNKINDSLSNDTIENISVYDTEHLTNSLNDPDYFSKYFNISDGEIQKRLENLDIKNKDEDITLNKVGTLVLQNKDGDYKIIQTLEYKDSYINEIYICDLFSEEILYKISYEDMKYDCNENGKYINIDLNNDFMVINENLKEYKAVEYDNIQYSVYFIIEHFDELLEKYATKEAYYTWDVNEQNEYLLKGEYNKLYSRIHRTIYDLALNYVKNVPIEFQVKSNEFEIGYNIDSLIEKENKTKLENLIESLKDPNYFANYFNISDEEVQKRLKGIDIKYPDKTITLEKVGTLVLKGSYNDYKIIQTGEYIDYENNKIILYDLFTEETLCSINMDDVDYEIGTYEENYGRYINIDPKKFMDISSKLGDYEIIEYGTVQYAFDFIANHFDEIIDNYASVKTYYYWNTVEQSKYLLGDKVGDYYKNITKTIYDLALNYVINVPYEFQIASKDFNLTSNNVENKYNIYKISDEELQERLSKIDIMYPNEVVDVSKIFTLVLENSNCEPKILLAIYSTEDDINYELYDLFTLEYLCDFKVRDVDNISFTNNCRLIDYDEKDFSNKTELLKDYYIKQIGLYDYSLSYMVENIDYFRNRDGIDYKIMSDPYYYFFPNGKKGVSMSTKDYAKAYVTYTPEELQIYSKELINSNDKKLVKID